MMIAIWIIAVCEVIRAVQNWMQIRTIRHDTGARDNCYAEFIKSLKQPDQEFVREMLKEFERLHETGYWEDVWFGDPDAYDCSECGAMVTKKTRFCPRCGRMMANYMDTGKATQDDSKTDQ